jgi:hypothetical protein
MVDYATRSGGPSAVDTARRGATADPSLLGHLRKRINELINANLRYTFGQ